MQVRILPAQLKINNMCNCTKMGFSLVKNEYTEYLYNPKWTDHMHSTLSVEWYSKYKITPEFTINEDGVSLEVRWHNTILTRYECGEKKDFSSFSEALEFFNGVKEVYDFHFSKEGVENRNSWYKYNCSCCCATHKDK